MQDDSWVPVLVSRIDCFFNKIITRRKTPASRNFAREMKISALRGIEMQCSCFFEEIDDAAKLAQSQMEVE